MKVCKRCDIEKILEDFSNNKNEKDNKSIYCKECEKIRKKIYREKNKEKINKKSREWRKENPDRYKEIIKKYLDKNPHMTSKERTRKYRKEDIWRQKFKESRQKYYLNNVDDLREKRKEYYSKNKEKLRKKNNEYKQHRVKTDSVERAKKNIRNRIREFLTKENKSKRTFDIIGLDKDNFKSYIENKFADGMTWENYGKWHIDHIIPLCEAKTENDVLKLNHYSNLQPLWAEDNLKKNRKI